MIHPMGFLLIFLKMKMSYHHYQVLKPVCPFIFYYFLFTFNRLSIFTATLYADPYSLNQGIEGPEGTVYANGVFILKIQIPERCIFFRHQNQTPMPH